MSQWYLSYDGQQFGPMDLEQARARAAADPRGYAWREGMADWQPIGQTTQLGASPPAAPAGKKAAADEVDYQIHGQEMQYVEVELDPGESAVAEAGAMMYKHPDIAMETIFGDGSRNAQQGGMLGMLLGAGKRLLTGESLFITAFTHQGRGKARVAFAAPYPGHIIPVSLAAVGGRLICQKDSFLCAARGVSIGIYFQRKIMTGLFGGEGFIMQQLEGDGLVFVHAGGTVSERELAPGEVLHVDTGCLVAFQESVDFDLEQVGGIKSALFGGEGIFFARVRGPGKVWLQSLPFSRLAGRMLAGAAGGRGEGSVLGGLFDGDNR
ncbi:MAG: TIGR00266 family protein [Candidatus Competibacteraceae bacterium]|nr:TIGR00266 family protein [Candidatus Competibacteraceae bacterium]